MKDYCVVYAEDSLYNEIPVLHCILVSVFLNFSCFFSTEKQFIDAVRGQRMFFPCKVNCMAVGDFHAYLRNRPRAFLRFAKSSHFFLVIKICLEKQTKKVTWRNLRNKKPVWKLSHVQLRCEWKDCSTLCLSELCSLVFEPLPWNSSMQNNLYWH